MGYGVNFGNRGGRGAYGRNDNETGDKGPFEPKPGAGTLFYKEKATDRHPDCDGYVILDRDMRAGERLRIAGWEKKSAKGLIINLKVRRELPAEQGGQDGRGQSRQQETRGGGLRPDDLPF